MSCMKKRLKIPYKSKLIKIVIRACRDYGEMWDRDTVRALFRRGN